MDGIAPNPPPSDPFAECRKLEQEIKSLLAERAALQEELNTAPPPQKSNIAAQIKALNAQIAPKNNQLTQCFIKHGFKPNLIATFNGKATLKIDSPDTPQPISRDVSIPIMFQQPDHAKVVILNFPVIVEGPLNTPIGPVTVTVTLMMGGGTGIFNPSTGSLSLDVPLHFDFDQILVTDSDLPISLSTSFAPGAPLNPTPGR